MSQRMMSVGVVGLAVLLAGASKCREPGTSSREPARNQAASAATTACDPLAGTPAKSTALGKLLGVGRDSDGTVYVIDTVPSESEPRVFVAAEHSLSRQRVVGSGDGNNNGTRLILLTLDATPNLTLALELAGSAKRMAIVEGLTKAPSFDELQGRRALEILADDFVAGFTAHDLGGEVVIEYVAKTAAGAMLVVTRPRDNWSYEDFRVFYGKQPTLQERNVDSVTRAKDGGSTTIDFEVDSSAAVAKFPVESSPDAGFQPGPASLMFGKEELALTRLATERSQLDGVKFLCFD